MAQPQGPGQLAPETAGAHSDGALVYGVAQRRARKNEDRYVVAVAPTSTRKDGTQSPPWCDLLLAVFDGHNGWRAAEECLDKAILQGFNDIDLEIRSKYPDGTTATVILLKLSPDGRCGVKCAWVGDSRACIGILDPGIKSERVLSLSRDHKASDPTEATRMDTFYTIVDKCTEGTAGRGGTNPSKGQSNATGTNMTAGDTIASVHRRENAMEMSSVKGGSNADPGSVHASQGNTANHSNASSRGAGRVGDQLIFDPRELGLIATMGSDGYWVIDAPQAPLQLRNNMKRVGSVNTPKKVGDTSSAGGTQHSNASSGGPATPGSSAHGPAAAPAGPAVGSVPAPVATTTIPKAGVAPANNVELNLNAYYDEKSCHGPTNVIDLKVYLKAEAIQNVQREQRDSRRESQRSRSSQKNAATQSVRVRAEVDDLLSKLGLTESEAAVLREQGMGAARTAPQPPDVDNKSATEPPPEDESEPSQRRRISFVGRLRDPNTGALSNLRLFGGRLGASTAMTRSIGDREAARSCISEPEIITMQVEASQKARVVICSDGVWDVYDNGEALTISKGGRLNAAKTPLAAAIALATNAQEDRGYDGLPPDDITVIIADIFGGMVPKQAEAGANAAEGGCCAMQ